MFTEKNHSKKTDCKIVSERQLGYLTRAVEDISQRLDTEMLKEEMHREKAADLKEEMTERTTSLQNQVSLLSMKVDDIEKSLKRFILTVGVVMSAGIMALDKLEPSAISSVFLDILRLFS